MKFINRVERKFGDYAIPNLTLYLIVFQGMTFFMSYVHPDFLDKLVLTHDALFAGEWWRLLTVLIVPPAMMHPVWLIFYLFLYFMVGTALEAQWGAFRYNLYILVGYLITVLAALIPLAVVSNFFLMESIFLAFAWLYPDFQFLLFFIFPVKVKWLGLVGWISFLIAFVTGSWATKAEVAGGTVNFLLFFWDDLLQAVRTSRRKFKSGMAQARARDLQAPMHVCTVCGVTDQSDRKMEFRYCPQCKGTPAYCINHIHHHEHR
jgi:hypothetical protein